MHVENGIITGDSYQLFVPIDDEILKSVTVDANGDYIVQGVMTSDDIDEEGDSITADGMDCSYFLEKGWVKYEHGTSPKQFIGEPIEVRVGRFPHPTLDKSINGVFVKSRLFAHRELTQEAVRTIQDLEKSNTKRRMGWSIEGNVKERDRKTGKIVKSVLRNVVLTMNPINTVTYAELAKSFAKNHELTIDTEVPADTQKAMDLAGSVELAKQSLEDSKKEKKKGAKSGLFYQFLMRLATKKSLMKSITNPSKLEMVAFDFGASAGLAYEEAEQFASYMVKNQEFIKSVLNGLSLGGEKMSKANENKNLEAVLDEDLEELKKALGADEEEDDNDDEEEKEEKDDDDDEEEEEAEKALKSDFAKSLSQYSEAAQAFEVSDFLQVISDEIGINFDGFQKSMQLVAKQQKATTEALMSVMELNKSLVAEIKTLKADNEELNKAFSEVLKRPVGRKSVVNSQELHTINKSTAGGGGQTPQKLNRAQVYDILEKAFEKGDISGTEIARFEANVPLTRLNLTADLRTQLGITE